MIYQVLTEKIDFWEISAFFGISFLEIQNSVWDNLYEIQLPVLAFFENRARTLIRFRAWGVPIARLFLAPFSYDTE